MTQHTPVKVSATQVKRAQTMWDNFVSASKLSTYGTCGVLLVLWLIFIAL